jgi:hypothetical protein
MGITGAYFSLDRVSTRIWSLLPRGLSRTYGTTRMHVYRGVSGGIAGWLRRWRKPHCRPAAPGSSYAERDCSCQCDGWRIGGNHLVRLRLQLQSGWWSGAVERNAADHDMGQYEPDDGHHSRSQSCFGWKRPGNCSEPKPWRWDLGPLKALRFWVRPLARPG